MYVCYVFFCEVKKTPTTINLPSPDRYLHSHSFYQCDTFIKPIHTLISARLKARTKLNFTAGCIEFIIKPLFVSFFTDEMMWVLIILYCPSWEYLKVDLIFKLAYTIYFIYILHLRHFSSKNDSISMTVF